MCFLVFLKSSVDLWNFIMTSFPMQYHSLLLAQYISQSQWHISKDLSYLGTHAQTLTTFMNSPNSATPVQSSTVSHVLLMCLELSCAYNVTTITLFHQINFYVIAQWMLLQIFVKL